MTLREAKLKAVQSARAVIGKSTGESFKVVDDKPGRFVLHDGRWYIRGLYEGTADDCDLTGLKVQTVPFREVSNVG